jgi:hypothetical protein
MWLWISANLGIEEYYVQLSFTAHYLFFSVYTLPISYGSTHGMNVLSQHTV